MTISHYERLPQGTSPNKPYFKYCLVDKSTGEVEQRLLVNRYVGSDPLTGRAYFDTKDVTRSLEPLKAHWSRAMKNRDLDWMELNVHADMIKAKAVHAVAGLCPSNGGGGIRGSICGFSRASRKRMIEFMAQARLRGQLLFATFTYPDEFPVGDIAAWKAHFEALRKRIERQYPGWSIVWRKELKERLSGENKGKLAPHYHMIIDTGIKDEPSITVEQYISYGKSHPKTTSPHSRAFEEWALQAWNEIVFADPDVLFGSLVIESEQQRKHAEHGCFVVACRNRRHAYKYISKYVAKEENDNFEVGRRWGRIGKWDTSNSECVILSKKEVIELKRLIRGWMKSKNIKFERFLQTLPVDKGFSVFGIGDTARTGDFWQLLINHAAQLSGHFPPFVTNDKLDL